jgi:hypothetical protein
MIHTVAALAWGSEENMSVQPFPHRIPVIVYVGVRMDELRKTTMS